MRFAFMIVHYFVYYGYDVLNFECVIDELIQCNACVVYNCE